MDDTPIIGRVAFITGASRGIGAATALALARRGAIPVLAVRDAAAAAHTVAAVRALGVACEAIKCDVADTASSADAAAACLDRFGRLDIVINNAGQVGPIGRLADVAPPEWLRALAVNLGGACNVVHAALPALNAGTASVIVNLSSGAAHTAREGWSAYCSSKAGLAMLTRSLALEYPAIASYGFQPGVVDTDMQAAIRASRMNDMSRIPRASLANPGRPAAFIGWLCAERPMDLSGQDIAINDAAAAAARRTRRSCLRPAPQTNHEASPQSHHHLRRQRLRPHAQHVATQA